MDFTAPTGSLEWLALLVAASAATSTVIGLCRPSTSRSRALAHPLVPLIAASVLVALGAFGQWVITHTVIDRGFAPTLDGWRRVALADVDAGAAMVAAASLQRFIAMTVAAVVPVAWIAAWRHDPDRETSAVVASVAATFAMSLPVLAGCGGIVWLADTMTTLEPSEAVWPAWHALEASKWAVAGLAAVGLMAATPIVMHAASRGNVVGARTHQLSRVVLLVGLAAWSTSRFANEDLVRGPMASLERGESAWHNLPEVGFPSTRGAAIQLPTGSRCVNDPVDASRQQLLPIELDAYTSGIPQSWPTQDDRAERERVMVAAVDRRAPPSVYQPALLRAQALGVERIAVLTSRDDMEPSLTFGTIHSKAPCVLGWIGIDHALRLSASGSSWTTLAYAASHPARTRRPRGSRPR